MNRAIVAIGRQDIEESMLTCVNNNIEIIGASSDHLILNIKNNTEYKVGSIVKFKLEYGSLLRCFTSKYVKKKFID